MQGTVCKISLLLFAHSRGGTLPDFIDISSRAPARQRRTGLLILLAVVFIAAVLGRIGLSYWVDLLWFKSCW
jgi:hypothetical protein